MTCTSVVRGSTVVFSATFYTNTGAVFTPSGAEVRVTYDVSGTPTTDTETMTLNSGVWTAQWDSNPADTGDVYWHVETTGGQPSAAYDGSFTLTANAANPQS